MPKMPRKWFFKVWTDISSPKKADKSLYAVAAKNNASKNFHRNNSAQTIAVNTKHIIWYSPQFLSSKQYLATIPYR